MLEWHAWVSHPDADTWMRGRFLEEWADGRVLAAMPDLFAHYDCEDVWRALHATMDTFRIVAVESAEVLQYTYPMEEDEFATMLVGELFEDRDVQ
jgi:aminoglycoside 6-adenylyltransferase